VNEGKADKKYPSLVKAIRGADRVAELYIIGGD
jgi:hypothetical protein